MMNIDSVDHGSERVEIYHEESGMFAVYPVETVFGDPITGAICGVEYQLPQGDATAVELNKDNFRLLW